MSGDVKRKKDLEVNGSWGNLFSFGFQMDDVNKHKQWRCEANERLGSKRFMGYLVSFGFRMKRLIKKALTMRIGWKIGKERGHGIFCVHMVVE